MLDEFTQLRLEISQDRHVAQAEALKSQEIYKDQRVQVERLKHLQ